MENWTAFGYTLKPGEKVQATLRIPMGGLANHGEICPGKRQGGDYEMPATLVNGANPGKTLLVTAGIHAGEFNGTPAVIRAAREVDPAMLAGRLILLPCVNSSGFWTVHPRTLPEDGFNLNSQYPGRPDGTVGDRVADFFVRDVFPQVDFILDLHGGSRGERMTPLVFFPTHPKVREASLAAAKALNIGFMIESQATRGEYSYAASAMDIPGLLIERGDGYFCEAEWVEANHRDLLLLMDHLGMVPAPAGTRDEAMRRRVFREAVYLESGTNGLWYPAVRPNTPVKAGQLLGTVQDFCGNTLEEIRSERDGHVLYVNTALANPVGEFRVAVAWADSEEQS